MSKPAIQASIIAICVMTLAGTSTVTLALSKTSHSKHLRKHKVVHWYYGPGYARPAFRPWPAGAAWPAAQPQRTPVDVCPGSGRSFECKVWPPPMDQDPDRKASGADAG